MQGVCRTVEGGMEMREGLWVGSPYAMPLDLRYGSLAGGIWPHTRGARRGQRKTQATRGGPAAGSTSKGTSIQGLSCVAERWVDLHTCHPNLTNLCRNLNWVQPHVQIVKAVPLKRALILGTVQRAGRGQEPPIAPVQLEGQPGLPSSPWPPPTATGPQVT